MRIFFAVLLWLCCSCVWALDKGHFQSISEPDFNEILKSFKSVKVYYPKAGGKGNIGSHINRHDPKIIFNTEHAIFLFYDAKEALKFLKGDKQGKIGVVYINNILIDQYKKRSVPTGSKSPLFVIRQNMKPVIETYEYLSHKNKSPYIFNTKDGRVISGFVTRELAIQAQKALEKRGIEVERVGLDERSFLKFIIDQAHRGIKVKMFGYDYR